MVCPICGEVIHEDEVVCPVCGYLQGGGSEV